MRILCLMLFWTLFLAFSAPLKGGEMSFCQQPEEVSQLHLQQILDSLRCAAQNYSAATPDYEANIYIKGNIDVHKFGNFVKLVPYFNRINKGQSNYSADYIGEVSFTNPNLINQSLYSISVKKSAFINEYVDVLTQHTLKLNLYSQYILGNLYSPLAYLSGRYYTYSIDSQWQGGCDEYVKIHFEPKIMNNKFISGYVVVSQRNWSVREMCFNGSIEFVKFNCTVLMGNEFSQSEFLPKEISLESEGKILGTHFSGGYLSKIKYNKISPAQIQHDKGYQKHPKREYDLTLHYTTGSDTLSMVADHIRKFRDSINAGDTSVVIKKVQPTAIKKVGQFVAKDYSIDMHRLGELSFSPLVSPIMFDYSSRNGLSYTQKLKYQSITKKDKMFLFEPYAGYNFKYKELYVGMNGEFLYNPQDMGSIFINLGNGNKFQLYHNNEESFLPNPIDYREIHATIGHRTELANGFLLTAGASLVQYRSIDKITPAYTTFVPQVEIQYTPGQYYYMNGNRKVYLYSKYPTFTLNCASALKGVFNSTIKYQRVEFDMQHRLQVGPMHHLQYRVGGGMFINSNNPYFSEFKYLKRKILPDSWKDDIGGTFHLLTPLKYTEIQKYLRGCASYEAPLLLVPSLLKKAKHITKERVYSNILIADSMDPYIEIGYGLGTAMFNIGLFWGGEITKWDMVGVKFTFEAFN